MFRKILGLTLFVFAAPALAGDLSYNYFQLGYRWVELDEDPVPGISVDGDGFKLDGAFEVGESWFITAEYSTVEFDFGIDLDRLGVGVGYHVDMSPNADFFATLSYISAEVSASGFGSVDEDGFEVGAGVRGMVSDKVELAGSLGYYDFGNGGDGTTLSATALYSFTDAFALGFTIETDEDITGYGLDARFYFGN